MFPFAIPMLLGAGAGALFNKKDPLKGALMGAGMSAVGGTIIPGLLGTAGFGGAAAGGQQAAMLAAQEAGLGSSALGWGGATTGLQGGLNGMMGANAGANVGGLLGNAEKIGNVAMPVMQAVNATRPPQEPMISPVVAPAPSTGPQGLSSLVQSNNQLAQQQQMEAMQRRLAQRNRYQNMIG